MVDMALHFPHDWHPTREEVRNIFRACNDNREHIEQWNEDSKNNNKP